jgi:hypothetical protein
MAAMIQERVRAGLARAKEEGKRLGRPKVAETIEAAIRKALRRKDRPGILKVAKELGGAPRRCKQKLLLNFEFPRVCSRGGTRAAARCKLFNTGGIFQTRSFLFDGL